MLKSKIQTGTQIQRNVVEAVFILTPESSRLYRISRSEINKSSEGAALVGRLVYNVIPVFLLGFPMTDLFFHGLVLRNTVPSGVSNTATNRSGRPQQSDRLRRATHPTLSTFVYIARSHPVRSLIYCSSRHALARYCDVRPQSILVAANGSSQSFQYERIHFAARSLSTVEVHAF